MMGFSSLEFVAGQVEVQSFEKRTVSNMFSQHVQDPASFLITDGIKHLLAVFVVKAHKVFFRIVTHQVALQTAEIFSITGILSIFVLIPKGLAIIGKRFVKGKVAPAFCSHIIAKPLVKQFMCNGAFPDISICEFSGILLGGFLVDGSGGILHGSSHILSSRNLAVLHPWIFNTSDPGKIGHHFRSVAKDFLGHWTELFFNIIVHFLSLPRIFYHGIITYTHEEKIRRVGQIHFPIIRPGAVIVTLLAYQFTIAQGDILGRHGHVELLGCFLLGLVDGWKPN